MNNKARPCLTDTELKDYLPYISALDEKLLFVFKMRFGLDPFFKKHTLKEIGQQLRQNAERIRQKEAKALRNIRYYIYRPE